MPSFTSKLTQFCFSIAQKKKLNNLNDIEKYIAKHSSHKPKRKYYKQLNINEIKVNNFSCYVVKPKKNLNDKVIIYAHGGAFIIQILNVHWNFIKRLANKTHCTIYVPIYPLSTKTYSSLHDSLEMIITLYKNLIKDYDSKKITLMGDSAGANISLIAAQQFKIKKMPPPAHIILLSPPVNLDASKEIMSKLFIDDKVLSTKLMEVCAEWYSQGKSMDSQLYSPINGDSKDIGYITIFIGDNEAFYPQNMEYSKKLKNEGIPHNLYIGREMFHIYPLFNMPESNEELKKINDMINN